MCEHHRNIGVEAIETDRGLLYPVDGSSALATDFDSYIDMPIEEPPKLEAVEIAEAPVIVEEVRETVPKVFKRREKREKKPEVRTTPPVQYNAAKKDDGDRLLEEINMLAGQGKKLGKKRGKRR